MTQCPFCGARLEDEATSCPRCRPEQPFAGAQIPTRSGSRARRAPAPATSSDAEPQVLPGIGYLLVAVGVAASFLPGWAVPGCFVIWVGCGVGLKASPRARWTGGLAVAVVLSVFGAMMGGMMNPPASPVNPDGPPPFLVVTVDSIVYQAGELRIVGTVENTGDGVAYDPAIELNVFNEAGATLLAVETAYPMGSDREELRPGRKATFAHLAFVPDEPDCVRWVVTNEDHLGEVVHHGVALDPAILAPARSLRLCESRAP